MTSADKVQVKPSVAQRIQGAVRNWSNYLPVVGLPVPEQQVSEPVPRGQGEHLLLQFNHGPPKRA